MKWYLAALKKYAKFTGRARRKEYWMFFLFNVIFGIVALLLDSLLGLPALEMGYGVEYGLIYMLYGLFVLIPTFAINFRRLHDQNKSGAWILIILIPIIGAIWYFVLMCLNGTTGTNRYGEDPKILENFQNDVTDNFQA